MKILHGERGTGKSVKCIEYAWATDSVILCASSTHKEILINLSRQWDMSDVTIVCVAELDKFLRGNHKPIIIDDVETVLKMFLLGEKIALATTSCEIKELPNWEEDNNA